MNYELSKNIVATVTYYDVLNFPMTAFEIWKHLIAHNRDQGVCDRPCSLAMVQRMLRSGQLSKKIEEKSGMYFLVGRGGLVKRRIQAEKISVEKLKRLRFLVKLIACVPYVHMIGVTGSLALKNGEKKSDWDLFIVLRSGKIWMGRTLLTGFLHLLRKRRHDDKIDDRACLNYFITDDNLEIATKDLFSSHEYRFLIPMLNFPLFQIFEIKNRWIREYRPNFSLTTVPHSWAVEETSLSSRIRRSLEWILNHIDLEKWLSSWQKEKIKRNPKSLIEGGLIEANDRALIFLPRPRGPAVFEKFKERLGV